ncbi:hypothetical protein Ddye_018231 [Dipteronia dyeriana]|uniref:RRM domain-containing protein n=1 Tax=Dipteronia dyeriana TaxID=168575 RepID=A0AAD9UAV6_9ROSI|nr:hypothetical protein Ddye_018231 [Dipteronia dyeriana]
MSRYEGKRDFRDNLFSIFVDNLNPKVDMACLWEIFKSLGRARDVFLSSKTTSRRKCFAFIRFESLEEARMVAENVNGRSVYGGLISSKVAAFGRKDRRKGVANQLGPRTGKRVERMSLEKVREGVESFHKTGFEGNRSFVDVLSRNQKCSVKINEKVGGKVVEMMWDCNDNEDGWLSRCAVGILKEFTFVSSINFRLRSKGLAFSSRTEEVILPHFVSHTDKEMVTRLVNGKLLYNGMKMDLVSIHQVMNKCDKISEVGGDMSRFFGFSKLKGEKVVGKKHVKDEGPRKSNDRCGQGDNDSNDSSLSSCQPLKEGSVLNFKNLEGGIFQKDEVTSKVGIDHGLFEGHFLGADIEDSGSGFDAHEGRESGDFQGQLPISSGGHLEDMETIKILGNSSMEFDCLSSPVTISGEGIDQQIRSGGVDLARKASCVDKGLVVASHVSRKGGGKTWFR